MICYIRRNWKSVSSSQLCIKLTIVFLFYLIYWLLKYSDRDQFMNYYGTTNHPTVRVCKTRPTGRMGNLLYQHVFWRLVSMKNGLPFKSSVGSLPYPFNNTYYYVEKAENRNMKGKKEKLFTRKMSFLKIKKLKKKLLFAQ